MANPGNPAQLETGLHRIQFHSYLLSTYSRIRSGDNCLFRANFDRHRTSIFPDAQDNPTGRVLPTGERKTEPRAVSGFPRSQSASASTRTTPILIPRLLSFCSSPHCDHSLPSDASVPQEEKYRLKTVTNTMKSDKLETLKMRKGRKKGEREGRRGSPALGMELLFFIINSLAIL